MIKLVYKIDLSKKAEEVEWLRSQLITPCFEDYYDWIKEKQFLRVGMIVNKEQALVVKLRHNIDSQYDWRMA